jgi:HAE1 family hydrophobic/amphiphilic exporter-1
MFTTQFRPTWAACSSTITTNSARTWQVYIESEAPYRSDTEKLGQFYVRNNQGDVVPLSALASFETRSGPEFTTRYNEYRSAQINASAAPGYSADQARAALEDVFKQTMPHEMGFDYLGMSYQEKKAEEGVPSSVIFGFSLLFVFLILAALYESWTLPFSVLLSTPVAVFCFRCAVAAPCRSWALRTTLHDPNGE